MKTYSANSLKALQENREEYIKKFIEHLSFNSANKSASRGTNFHSIIYYYLMEFEIGKIEKSLPETDFQIFQELKSNELFLRAKNVANKKMEYPFLVKCKSEGINFCLTGRFDTVLKEDEKYTILDWKTVNLPKNPEEDLQTIVYLYCASKLFKSENVSIVYFSLEKKESIEIKFNKDGQYIEKICEIIKTDPSFK